MKYVIERNFEKSVKKIKDVQILQKVKRFLNLIENAKSINEIPSTKQLVGFPKFYRTKMPIGIGLAFI